MLYTLQKGFISRNGQVKIIDEDRLCYIVENSSKGVVGLRTISKELLKEYVEYFQLSKHASSASARDDLSGKTKIDKFEYGYTSTLAIMAKMVLGDELSEQDKLIARGNISKNQILDEPLQIIFYGAPGTGKSFKIDGMTNDANSVRTTFHPDSDYASFVGAYKPTMQPMPIHAFVGTTVHKAKTADNAEATEKKIVYKYVPQAFLKAYVAAWKDLENPHFLIIEEINRGNCAQIFGDLFQLLDRNTQGASSYAINADEDISQFLATDDNGFANVPKETADAIRNFVLQKDNKDTVAIGVDILSGKKLLLPPNLYIWATMNTSDQSLFPIDSAFKRRWNWEYIPIRFFENDAEPSLAKRSFQIGNTRYSWAHFLKIINPTISELTESADKQIGFFFAKPDKKSNSELKDNDVISEKIFLNKVLFYLWTDVLKDFNIGGEEFKKPDGKNLEFADFFAEGNTYLADFVAKLGIEVIADIHDDADDDADHNHDGLLQNNEGVWVQPTFTVNGVTQATMIDTVLATLKIYFDKNPDISTEDALSEWNSFGLPKHALETEEVFNARTDMSKNRASKVFVAQDGRKFYVSAQLRKQHMERLIDKANSWGIKINRIS